VSRAYGQRSSRASYAATWSAATPGPVRRVPRSDHDLACNRCGSPVCAEHVHAPRSFQRIQCPASAPPTVKGCSCMLVTRDDGVISQCRSRTARGVGIKGPIVRPAGTRWPIATPAGFVGPRHGEYAWRGRPVGDLLDPLTPAERGPHRVAAELPPLTDARRPGVAGSLPPSTPAASRRAGGCARRPDRL
jgi:hypothetical protein